MPDLNSSSLVVKIVLGESLHAGEFDLNRQELLHPFEYAKAKELIDQRIKEANDLKKDEPNPVRRHDHEAITVFGTRGSGKTSFLLSLKKEYKSNTELEVLKIIDPTLIEEKGHIFLTIISSVAESVEEMLKKEEIKPPNTSINARKDWKDKMMELAAGLPGLDGIGKDNSDGWQDPEFVMDAGMMAVKAAKNLADNFDEFLKISLKILQKDAFLLFLDDIDVHAGKGIAVLETIRKYLITRRMITVVSGDIGLYMLAIRNRKWENFGKVLLKYEGETMNKVYFFNDKVTELTAQYLLKVMQPAHRIYLTTLLEKRYTQSVSAIRILSGKEEKGEGIDIGEYYNLIFNEMGVYNRTQLEVYTTFMLGLPARTQIQFFLLNKSLNDKREKNTEAISDVFIADLTEKDVDIALANQTPKYFCAITLKLLLAQRKLLDLYQLQPTTTDASLNGSMMALWMLFSWYTKRETSFLIFDYFIKIAYVRNLLTLIPYRATANNKETGRVPDIEDLCEVGDIFNDGVLRDVTSAIQSYLLGALEKSGNVGAVSPFFARLYSLRTVSKNNRNDTIDAVFNKSTKADCTLAFIPCYSSTYANKNESRVMYSIYVLLGTIGELIKRYETVDHRLDALQNDLKILSQFRSYIIPDFRDSRSGTLPGEMGGGNDQSDDLQEAGSDEKDTTDKVLAEIIHHWIGQKPKVAFSTHLLGKMITRFFYAMNNIASAFNTEKNMKLGELFYYQVTAFMNAVLVEDVTEKGNISLLNINNTRLSDTIFLDNLQKVIKWGDVELKKLSLSRWLLSCPLLHAYLRWDEHDEKRIAFQKCLSAFCGEFRDVKSFEYSISYQLDKVGIVSNKAEALSSPDLLNDYEELIKYLKVNKVPRRWFTIHKDPAWMEKWNNNIIETESAVFGNGKQAVVEINKFRKYLKLNRTKWK